MCFLPIFVAIRQGRESGCKRGRGYVLVLELELELSAENAWDPNLKKPSSLCFALESEKVTENRANGRWIKLVCQAAEVGEVSKIPMRSVSDVDVL